MRPRRDSRELRWTLHVLMLSSLLYAGLILSWTLQHPVPAQNSPSAAISQGNELAQQSRDHVNHTSSNAWTQDGVMDLLSDSSQVRRLQCLGWRATAECSPNGSRRPQDDQDCNTAIPGGTSGYCEVKDLDSNERFMTMKRTCDKRPSLETVFRCIEAPGFANFRAKAQQVMDKILAPGYTLPNVNNSNSSASQGIVMVAYPKLVASAYATVRALREVLNCNLPIEIWLRRDEMNVPGVLEPLLDLSRNKSVGDISFQAIHYPQAVRFKAKVYAIHHSKFQQVLFLDADNVPVRDPSYLFKTHEFVKTGAVFWPDFWHPQQTIFAINQTSLVWQLLDMPFVDI